jgi:archaellum component FlaC
MITEQQINEAYKELSDLTMSAYLSSNDLSIAREKLEEREYTARTGGEVQGKNEQERKDAMRALTTDLRDDLNRAERQHEVVQMNLNRAKIEVRRIEALIAIYSK